MIYNSTRRQNENPRALADLSIMTSCYVPPYTRLDGGRCGFGVDGGDQPIEKGFLTT